MKSFLFAAALAIAAVLSAPAYAAGGLDSNAAHAAGFSKLSETEKAEIIKQIATKAQANEGGLAAAVTSAAQPEKVDQWLNIGERIGKMIGGAAKEVGVAVNDFVKTPVGLTAMGLIVWHYMGGMLIHAFGGLVVLTVGLSFVLFIARRYTHGTITYDTSKRDYLGRALKVSEERRMWTDGDTLMFAFYTAVVVGASLITMFTY